jgi:RNA polymerase sigma-70 factor (ECF subfamily)
VSAANPRSETDEDLMRAAAKGSREAFAAIVDRHHARLLGLMTFLTGDREMARDLTQDCFVKLLRAAPRYEPRAKFRTYLATIARRLVIDAKARAWERREPLDFEPAAPNPGPDAAAERRERSERLAAVLATLAAEDREALVLSEAGGLKQREIAELVGAPEGTVASRKNRAVRLVRERWRARWKEETP